MLCDALRHASFVVPSGSFGYDCCEGAFLGGSPPHRPSAFERDERPKHGHTPPGPPRAPTVDRLERRRSSHAADDGSDDDIGAPALLLAGSVRACLAVLKLRASL